MGYSQSVIKTVEELFENRRKEATDKANANNELVYAKVPVVREIDHALSLTGLNVYKAALSGKDGLDERIERLKKENLALQEQRRELLVGNGFSPDFTEIKYKCKKCNDTGYVGISMCSCKKKELVKAAFRESGLGGTLNDQTFSNFDLNYYSDTPDSSGASDRDNMKSILEKSKRFVSDFGKEDKASNLMFVGKTGLGKTHITTAIAKGIIEKGYDVVYESAQNILGAFESSRFEHSENAKVNTDRYFNCDLLIIDDLGTEFRNTFTQSALYNLINTRINACKPIIISTNLDNMAQFRSTYDDRIVSRLAGTFRTFSFKGDDIRLQKARNANKN